MNYQHLNKQELKALLNYKLQRYKANQAIIQLWRDETRHLKQLIEQGKETVKAQDRIIAKMEAQLALLKQNKR